MMMISKDSVYDVYEPIEESDPHITVNPNSTFLVFNHIYKSCWSFYIMTSKAQQKNYKIVENSSSFCFLISQL